MSVENNVYDDLRTSIRRVWPETATTQTGIYETDHIDKIAWESLTPPYAVICIESFPETDQGSSDTVNYMPEPQIWYVMAVAGPLTAMRDKLSALKDDLLTNTFTNFELWNVPMVEYSRTLQPNNIFAEKRMPHQAGRVTARCFVGTDT